MPAATTSTTHTETQDRILDAAYETLRLNGLSRFTPGDVARLAGLSRQTVYRYFPSRDELLAAAILREQLVFVAAVRAAAEPHADLHGALSAMITETLRLARSHPLLDRLLATEPERLLPFLAGQGTPLLEASAQALAQVATARAPQLPAAKAELLSDALTRLLISLVVNPRPEPPQQTASAVTDLLLWGLVGQPETVKDQQAEEHTA